MIVALLGSEVLKTLVTKIPSSFGYFMGIIIIALQTLLILGFLYYALFAGVFGRKLRKKLFVIYFLASFACLVGVLELVFTRWLHHPATIPSGLKRSYKYFYDLYNLRIIQYEKKAIAFDDKLLYTLRPETDIDFSNAEFATRLSINKAGCRDDDSSASAPEIICLGDSFTMGWGIDQSQSFSQIIERETGMKTLNAGTPSYGTARELLLLERLDTSKLKYVIIQYCSNDWDENVSFVANNYSLALTPLPVFKSSIRSYELSRQYFPGKNFLLIGNVWMKYQLNRVYPLFRLEGQPYNDGFDGSSHAAVFLKVLMKYRERFKNIKIVVTDVDVFKYRDNTFIDELQRQAGQLEKEQTKNIVFVNTINDLTDKDYFILDHHINAEGHRKVAAKLLGAIKGIAQDTLQSGVGR